MKPNLSILAGLMALAARTLPVKAAQTVKAETEYDESYDSEAEEKKRRAQGDYPADMFVMVTIDVEVRSKNFEAWEGIETTDDLFGNPELVKELEAGVAQGMDNIHFVEAVASDEEGNLV